MENTNINNVEVAEKVDSQNANQAASDDEEQEKPMTEEEKALWDKIEAILKEHHLT